MTNSGEIIEFTDPPIIARAPLRSGRAAGARKPTQRKASDAWKIVRSQRPWKTDAPPPGSSSRGTSGGLAHRAGERHERVRSLNDGAAAPDDLDRHRGGRSRRHLRTPFGDTSTYAHGAEILSRVGDELWFHPAAAGEEDADFRTQTLHGQQC